MRAKDLFITEQNLFEINMSPSSLQRLAGQINALAGMEFEMIVPNVGNIDDDGDMEPDYDQDESVVGIRDAVNFFDDGEWNSSRAIRRMEESMRQDYEEWVMEHFDDWWADNAPVFIREYLEMNANEQDIVDILELEGEEAQAILDDGPSKHDYNAAAEKVFDERDSSSWYDSAMDAGRQEYITDDDREEEWLHSQGIRTMMDIQNTYDVTWPHYTSPEGNAEANIDEVANEFTRAVGKPVNASTSYHGGRREAGHYVVEPDGSLSPNEDDDQGLEFVSYPMPVSELLQDLNKVKAWADKRGCYTNKSTGLHINVSVPNFSMDRLDYVKLAVLLGDEYVLNQFGRISNNYAKSALNIVKRRVSERPEDARAMLDQMRNHLGDVASKVIHSGSTDKYTSINTKTGYIEFRSPGGDWLNANFDKIENTLLRFVVAMDAAIDPNKYRDEYLKKLYKILAPKTSKDTIAYFAQYVAGEIPKAALRSFVKQAQLERKVAKNPTGGQPMWWRVEKEGRGAPDTAIIEVVATTKQEALEKARIEWNIPDGSTAMRRADAYPIKPYDESPVRASVGEPQAIGQRSGPTVGGRPSNPEGGWVISPESDRSRVAYRFNAAGFDDANVVRRQWAADNPGVWIVQRDENRTLGQPYVAGSTMDLQRQRAAQAHQGPQHYEIYRLDNGQVMNRFIASNTQEADSYLNNYAQRGPHSVPADRLAYRPIQSTSQAQQTGQEYRIRNMNDRTILTGFRAANQQAAEQEAEVILRDLRLDPDNYDVIPLYAPRQAGQPQAPLGGQNFPRDTTQQPATRSMVPGREHIGWEIRIGGRPVHQISGIGNNQGDANRIAQQWILQQGSDFLRQHQGGEVEVLPLWREI